MQDGTAIAGSIVLSRADAVPDREGLFVALVERQSRFVFRVAYAILRRPEEAEDVVQETFLKLYRSGSWQGIQDEKAFLARTAWRLAVDRLPKRRLESPDEGAASPEASPEEAAIAADRWAILQRSIDALPEALRQPLALSTVEELDSRRIATLMGLPEGTVRTRLMRARQILQEKLSRQMRVRHER